MTTLPQQRKRIEALLSEAEYQQALNIACAVWPNNRAALTTAIQRRDVSGFRDLCGLESPASIMHGYTPVTVYDMPEAAPTAEQTAKAVLIVAACAGGVAIIGAVSYAAVVGILQGVTIAFSAISQIGVYIAGGLFCLYIIGLMLRRESAPVQAQVQNGTGFERNDNINVVVNIHSGNTYGNAQGY